MSAYLRGMHSSVRIHQEFEHCKRAAAAATLIMEYLNLSSCNTGTGMMMVVA